MSTPVKNTPILVQKYGGTSVATADQIRSVAKRVAAQRRQGKAVVVVVSAMGKTTDELVALSRELSSHPARREMDMLLHAGEIISASLLAIALEEEGESAVSLTGSQAGMITDETHMQARIEQVEGERILRHLTRGRVVVITGFQGVSRRNEITTLGRGGSDTSAVAFAVGIGARQCEILTDVDGVYTADPRIVENPQKLSWCSYDEMLEMASLGAKVLHSRSVEIARKFGIELIVSSSAQEAPGTLVCSSEKGRKEFGEMEEVLIRGVAHNADVAKVSLFGVPDEPGIAGKVFEVLGAHSVNILLIVQAESHEGHNDISFLVSSEMLSEIQGDLDTLSGKIGARKVVVDQGVGTVSVVGEGVQRESGIAGRMFNALAEEGINIDLISTSNLMISCVVAEEFLEKAVQAVHREFLE
ncbi:MAG: aspartate kinase [Planctomycetota bacterium]|nr:aspartate kinase [Planctomycetota bacterium]MEE3053280.1 aspartate kinase [Planctomycetota bacterium]|tara:strand:- start:134 stop:1381 length:1248 start_codon:yes stop_codon:yes gene_type:complete